MKEINEKIQEQFIKLCKTGKLFRSALIGDKIWELYINSFEKEEDPIFRDPNSTEHNCNFCKNFIRRYGNIVAINEKYEMITIFDVKVDKEYQNSCNNISKAIKKKAISNIFFETFEELNSLPYESCTKSNSQYQLGVAKNVKRYTKEEAEKFGVVKPNETKSFNHIHLFLPKEFVDYSGKSIESIMSDYKSSKEVFQRAMETISLDTLLLVKDLINQESLLDGKTHLYKIKQIIPLKQEYDELSKNQRDNYCWLKSYKLPFAKFRNELIGVLCSELSEGKEINEACQAWNKRVDPINYMKTTAPITKKQIEEAKRFVIDNGYEESFNRRFANIDDIKVSEILHSNVGKGEIKSISIFDDVKFTFTRHKRNEFDDIEEIHIDKFMKDILPECSSVEVFLKNNHEGNLVSLTTCINLKSKPIFKWDNNYSWTFNGNLAGKSQIKEAVKTSGGKIDGVLRFSMMWADGNGDNSDLDLHCIEPNGNEIYFGNNLNRITKGNLDIDITTPYGKLAVENITFPKLELMSNGIYKLFIRQFNARNSKGFKAEIEFNNEVYDYEYNNPIKGNIQIAQITLNKGKFSIEHILPESTISSKELYSLETNQFHKVNLICLSPNHWDKNDIGNKHYFFMLDNCKAQTSIRSFHNENLIPSLAEHRKVMEVLGTANMIQPTERQLSGLGFNVTVRDELLVKLSGNFKRMIKIKF